MRTRILQTLFTLTLCSCLALCGCGPRATPSAAPDNSVAATGAMSTSTDATAVAAAPDATEVAPVKLTGQIVMPNGLLPKPAVKTSSLFDDLLGIKPAYGFVGVGFCAGISVGCYNSDAYGVAVGDPICVATTDDSGYYAMDLPEAYVPDPSLVIQVSEPGDDGYCMRRMCTGVEYQDCNMNTEIGVDAVLADQDTYPVDVRYIPAEQYDDVYFGIGNEFVAVDVDPFMTWGHGHRRDGFRHVADSFVGRVRTQPAIWDNVQESVQGTYEVASVQGRGVLTVNRGGGVAVVGPALRPGRAVEIAAMPRGNVRGVEIAAMAQGNVRGQAGPQRATLVAQQRAAIVSRGIAEHPGVNNTPGAAEGRAGYAKYAARNPEPARAAAATGAAEHARIASAAHAGPAARAGTAEHAAPAARAGGAEHAAPAARASHAAPAQHAAPARAAPAHHAAPARAAPAHQAAPARAAPAHQAAPARAAPERRAAPARAAAPRAAPARSAEKPRTKDGNDEKMGSHPAGGAEKPDDHPAGDAEKPDNHPAGNAVKPRTKSGDEES